MIFKKSDDNSAGDFPPRKMVQGNWKCAGCGKVITELPFEPAPDRPIYCRDCWMEKRGQRGQGGQRGQRFGSRKMVQGNWECADCGKEITELPFEPTPGSPIYCRDCWLKRRT